MDEISEIKNEKRILDAIDQLRRRKARPDVDRICNYMMRKFLIDPGETVADLERLVDADVVIKVEYKGNTSYRNAAKWSRYALYKNRPESASILTLNSERMSALFAAALTELSSRDTSPATGVSYSEIETYLQRKDAHFSKKLLDFMILRELNAGNILRLGNGNFVLTATGKDRSTNADNIKPEEKDLVKENEEEEEEKPHLEESENANNTNKPSNKSNIVNGKSGDGQNSNVGESGTVTVSGFRIGVRRKRAKIVFDPSDHRAPAPRKRGRPAGSSNKNNHHQHHISVHLHHSNNSSNNNSHISSSSSSSNSSTNGSHGLGISLSVSGRHPLDLKDQIFKAHRPSSVVQPQANNDNKRPSITCSVEGHCYVCGQGSNCRGNPERLIDCRDCVTNKVHPSCLEQQNGGISGMDGDSSSRNLGHTAGQSWQCADCRSCCICGGVSDSSSMVSCDGCEEWYHIYCHTPVLHERPRGGKWLCQQCLQDRAAYAHSVNGVGGLPTPRESPIPEGSQHQGENGICENGIADIDNVDTKHSTCIDHGETESKNTLSTPIKQKPAPDASNWTPVDVEFYFRSVGFPEQAHVFRDQEVDGKSLLLMKRSDVLTGLGLKLGPALKMYTHVRRLQLRQHDDMASSDFIWT